MDILLRKLHFSWTGAFMTGVKQNRHLEWLVEEIETKYKLAQNDTGTEKTYCKFF